MENRRIWGTNLYASFDGFIYDQKGERIKTGIIKGKYYFKHNNKIYLVHRVIAETFICPSKRRIKHIDGDKKNNAAWNLEYI